MFNMSPYLDGFPVLSVRPDALSTYGMRVANCDEHLCTAEVAACVLEVAGELAAGQALQLWFNLFSSRYMAGRVSRAPGEDETPLLQALDKINGGVAAPAVEAGEPGVAR
ncbi:DTW domain protein [compost metagenome]